MALNPKILGRPLFPSVEKTGELLQGAAKTAQQIFTPSAGSPPPTMAGVTVPPAGASLSQFQYKGPLMGTNPVFGSMFGMGNEQKSASQPASQPYNYGLFAATAGLPKFDVTQTQTPFSQTSATSSQQLSNLVANRAAPQQAQVPTQDLIFPLPADQRSQGRTPINIRGVEPMSQRSATLYATPEQLTNFASRQTAYEGRTPEQQQTLLAQIRSQGPQMAQNRIAQQDEYFKQKRAESKMMSDATTEAFKSGVSPEKIAQARSSYYQSQPNTLAGIRNEFQSMVPEFGTPMEQRTRVAGVRSSFGLPAGGPQPMQGSYTPSFMANNNEDRFQSIFRNIRSPFRNV